MTAPSVAARDPHVWRKNKGTINPARLHLVKDRKTTQAVRNSDEVARRLVLENRGLVFHVMFKFRIADEDRDDVEQECMVQLFRAAQRYDFTQAETKFSTFGAWYIRGAISNFLRKKKRWGYREITNSDFVDALSEGFDIPSRADRASPPKPHETYDPIEAADHEQRMQRLSCAMLHLNARDQMIVRLRSQGRTLQEIGDELDLCRERVRQLSNRALWRLRALMQVRQR